MQIGPKLCSVFQCPKWDLSELLFYFFFSQYLKKCVCSSRKRLPFWFYYKKELSQKSFLGCFNKNITWEEQCFLKGATKLYLMHIFQVVIILFCPDLCKSAFSTYSFDKNSFSLSFWFFVFLCLWLLVFLFCVLNSSKKT